MQSEIKAPSGKMYNLAPLTIEDIISLKTYCQFMPFHTLSEYQDNLPEEFVKPELARLLQECSKTKVTEADIDKYVGTLEGARELLYLALRHNHDGLTKQEVGTILTLTNFEEVVKQLLMFSGMWEEEKAANPPRPPRRKKPSR